MDATRISQPKPSRVCSETRASADLGLVQRDHEKCDSLDNSRISSKTSFDGLSSGTHIPTAFSDPCKDGLTNPTIQASADRSHGLEPIVSVRSHIGEPLENLYSTQTRRSQAQTAASANQAVDDQYPTVLSTQCRPSELSSLATELIFVLVCSSGQLLFAFFQANVIVTQQAFRHALGIQNTELPWLAGSYLVALGLSVILFGSLSDLMPPRLVIVAAFTWLTIWNIIGVFSLTPSTVPLFFFMRAMQGLAVGVVVSGSMSILGRVYSPGLRKTRVFSGMAAMAPFGFWLGAMQGGALSSHLEWIFGSSAMIAGLGALAAWYTIPPLNPAVDAVGTEAPTIRDFDWKGAIVATTACICLLFGLTQGTVAHWSPYTWVLIVVGVFLLVLFFFVEHKVTRPLIPNSLWKTRGFAPLMAAYFLGFGSFVGCWQFYAVQFFLNVQAQSSLIVALYMIPNTLVGIFATFVVSKLLHRIPGHYIYSTSMFAFALGPAFFLGNQSSTTYWALSMPGIALVTFGPDLSFAAASIFITSNVPKSYQGSAGSLLVTIQNLSSAIMTSVGDSVAAEVDTLSDGTVGLQGLKAAWWVALAAALAGAIITIFGVRIPKEVEKEHVT